MWSKEAIEDDKSRRKVFHINDTFQYFGNNLNYTNWIETTPDAF